MNFRHLKGFSEHGTVTYSTYTDAGSTGKRGMRQNRRNGAVQTCIGASAGITFMLLKPLDQKASE